MIFMAGTELYYRRHLPHYQPEGETYHVVFRLTGSVPASAFRLLKEERGREEKRIALVGDNSEGHRRLREHRFKYFERFEHLLDTDNRGPFWLRKPEIAKIVDEAMRYYDGKKVSLFAYTIMPNHVHLVFELLPEKSVSSSRGRDTGPATAFVRRVSDPTKLGRDGVPSYRVTNILASIKKFSALRANRVLGRHGAFWHEESYDHVIRDDEELEHAVYYVLDNPVKAGFCRNWREWKWTYLKKTFIDD